MRTLFLMPDTWDLALDTSGNIASATSVYQQAQDIASAGRTFVGDLYYDVNAGIPYFQSILGTKGFPLALYKMHLEEAAKSIPGVVSAQAELGLNAQRQATGYIAFTNDQNQQGQITL